MAGRPPARRLGRPDAGPGDRRAPELPAGCGPEHVLVGHVDAPVDIRIEVYERSDGQTMRFHGVAQPSRHTVGAVIAAATSSAMGEVGDTVPVRLVRPGHRPAGFGPDRASFTFVRDRVSTGSSVARWLPDGSRTCDLIL